MFTNPQRLNCESAHRLRRELGTFLRELRLKRGLVQRDIADAIQLRYYTQWAQIENGVGRVPQDRYHLLAAALGVAPGSLARRLMRGYDPVTFSFLFGEAEDEPVLLIGIPGDRPVPVPAYTAETARALRLTAGEWLKERREAVGLAQTKLADLLGYRFYTRISQIERGVGRVPPEDYGIYAGALELEPRSFVKTLFGFYDPMVHHLAFTDRV